MFCPTRSSSGRRGFVTDLMHGWSTARDHFLQNAALPPLTALCSLSPQRAQRRRISVPLDPQEQQILGRLTRSLRERADRRLPFSSCTTWGCDAKSGAVNKNAHRGVGIGLFGSALALRHGRRVCFRPPRFCFTDSLNTRGKTPKKPRRAEGASASQPVSMCEVSSRGTAQGGWSTGAG